MYVRCTHIYVCICKHTQIIVGIADITWARHDDWPITIGQKNGLRNSCYDFGALFEGLLRFRQRDSQYAAGGWVAPRLPRKNVCTAFSQASNVHVNTQNHAQRRCQTFWSCMYTRKVRINVRKSARHVF